MQNFLHQIRSSLSVGQQQVLRRFLEDVRAGRVAARADEIDRLLSEAGSLLPQPDVDATTPDGYNAALRTLIANCAGLYQEVDLLESILDALADLNRTELERIEVGTRDQATLLENTRQANASNSQWSDIFFETFGADVNRETGREWYQPIPVLESSGQVESFLPLQVDPADRALKLFVGGDFSRSTNAQGQPLAQVEVEEILGISVDQNHPLRQAIDNQYFTFWRELILADAPIQADPFQVPWLPTTYTGGAACRLHFRWPFAVPFTEIVLRPFADKPVQVLQAVFDNRKIFARNRLTDGRFASGAAFWTVQGSSGIAVTYPVSGGFQNKSHARVVMPSGRVFLQSNTFISSGTEYAYHLTGKVKRDPNIRVELKVFWRRSDNSILRVDSHEPDIPPGEWFEYSKLFIAPSGWIETDRANIALVADGSGTVLFTDTRFVAALGALTFDQENQLESDTLVIPLDNANGTDIWLTLAQPHYQFLSVALPEGELDSQALWEEVRLQAEAAAANIQRVNQSPWRLEGEPSLRSPAPLPEDGSTLMREVNRLGGRIRDAIVNLLRYARPSQRTRTFNRYMYLLGAWEIQVRHREYAPQGLFVSKPYKPRGEVREINLITNPPLSELGDRVRFWITARANDKTDKAKRFTGRATFSSSTETVSNTAETHFTLTPVTRRETFDGTDRLNRVALEQYPYVDRQRVWTVHTRLTSGNIDEPLVYDPNKEIFYLNDHGTVTQVAGYRPIRVTLEFSNGTIARPDVLGELQKGDIGASDFEILEEATVEQELTLLNEDVLRRIQQRVSRAAAGQRQQLLERLVEEELRRQQLRASRETKQRKRKLTVKALQTRFKNIVSGPNGVAFSLYWHKSGPDAIAKRIITSGDVLISPSRYTVDAANGLIVVRDVPPSGNTEYDSFIAYYKYFRDEEGARDATDSRSASSIPTSGIDFGGTLTQSLPITRNVTDYVRGEPRRLRPAVLDDLDPDYYPIFEYIVDDRGRLVFANNLSRFGDTPATIIAEYETLQIEPRLIIEYTKGAINEFSTKTPVIHDYTLLMSSRR